MQKISKKQARRLYDSGIEVLFVPSKCVPNIFWRNVRACINQASGEVPFDTFINHYRYYNCDRYNGLGIHFYKLDENGN